MKDKHWKMDILLKEALLLMLLSHTVPLCDSSMTCRIPPAITPPVQKRTKQTVNPQ
jgi:hypothetical protein